jgi:hypothetical protein
MEKTASRKGVRERVKPYSRCRVRRESPEHLGQSQYDGETTLTFGTVFRCGIRPRSRTCAQVARTILDTVNFLAILTAIFSQIPAHIRIDPHAAARSQAGVMFH